MDALLTSGTESVDEDQDVTTDPAAPYGRRPDGTPYKRDPAQMARIRAARGAGSAGARKGGPAPARPSRTAGPAVKGSPKKSRPQYGKSVASAVVTGANAMLTDPVERAIMRHQGARLALIVDRLLDEDPRLLQWVERLRLRMAGGAKGEAVAWVAGTGMLMAVHRGYRHPVLVGMFGGALEQIQAEAVAHEQQQAADRAELAAMMQQLADEEKRIVAEYAANAEAPAAPMAAPFAQFAGGARAP